jgi:hypothetical protein
MLILCEDMTSDHRPKIFKKIEEVRGGNQIHKIMLLCFRFLRCTHTYTTAIRLPHVHIHILADFCSSSSSPTLLVDCRQWIWCNPTFPSNSSMITIYFILACKDVRKRMLVFVLLLDRLMNCMHQVKL